MNNGYNIGQDIPAPQGNYLYDTGWCRTCGCRLGYEGTCPNCHAWWRSPLAVIGLPLTLVGLFLVMVLATNSSTSHTTPLPQSASRTTNAPNLLSPESPFGQPRLTTPTTPIVTSNALTMPTFPTQPAFVAPAPSLYNAPQIHPHEVALAELQQLRSIVWAADRGHRYQQSAYTQWERQNGYTGNYLSSARTGAIN